MSFHPLLLLLLPSFRCFGEEADGLWLSSRRSACKPVPSSMSLCHGVGYSEMRLPNLLGHDTMKEALQQAASWVPLLTKQCHRETKKFLCSLFAPVCISQMEEPVFPCRSLCEAVRDSCLPVMAAFGFPWPEMLNCSRFPGGNELCIPPVGPEDQGQPPREDTVCTACTDSGPSEKDFLEKVCNQDFALKMTIKSLTGIGGDLKVIPELRGRTLYRQASWSEEERKKPVLWLARWRGLLLRGQPPRPLLGPRWKHGEKELKRFSRAVRKLQC
uniref:FZ domain-containing protein n=1 Tax=Naja naja TaxID=35670 RepID=A0A8C7E1M9_NAJNA